jgi:hypothetical protein
MLSEGGVVRGNVKASNSTDTRVAQRRYDCSQIVGIHTDVAVIDYKDFVLSFIDHAYELGYFVIDCGAARAIKNADATVGEILLQFVEDRNRGIALIMNAEDQFEVWVILAAITGEIFVGFRVETANRLEITYRRREVRVWRKPVRRIPEKADGAVESK